MVIGEIIGHEGVENRAHVCKADGHSYIAWFRDSSASLHRGQ